MQPDQNKPVIGQDTPQPVVPGGDVPITPPVAPEPTTPPTPAPSQPEPVEQTPVPSQQVPEPSNVGQTDGGQ